MLSKDSKKIFKKKFKSSKLRLGDKVVITTGKDRKKIGDIIAIDRILGMVKIKGANLVSKFTKEGITTTERFIDVSNVQHIDENGKTSRVGIKTENNKKYRYLKSTGKTISVIMDYTKRERITEVSQ